MKIVFLASSFTIIYYMRFHPSIKFTYDKQQDTFRTLFVVVPCAVLALLVHMDWSIREVRAVLLAQILMLLTVACSLSEADA